MNFNLANTARVFVEAGPYKALTEEELVLLTDEGTVGASVTVSGGETLSVTCDLGARYELNSVLYYRDAATTESIQIFGKQSINDIYTEIVLVDTGVVISGTLEGPNKYQFLKVVHSAITGNSAVYEFEVISEGQTINFGPEGITEKYAIDSGTTTLGTEEVFIYNSDASAHNFHCLLDADDPDSYGVQLGLTSSGTFFGVYSTGVSVPETFDWPFGHLDNVVESNDFIELAPASLSGVYYTPVIDISAVSAQRFFWKASISGSNKVDLLSSVDNNPTVGVRLSDVAPTDGGWVSGQLSYDSNWSTASGSLIFEPYSNNTILDSKYKKYFQAKVELTTISGESSPILEKVGIEQGVSLFIPAEESESIFVRSTFDTHTYNRETSLVVWYFDPKNTSPEG